MEGYLRSQCSPKKRPHEALIQKPATRQHMPVSYPSILYLNNTDQTKYGSFIKKMAEDFTTSWENIFPIHIQDAQHILSIHKYDQAYHDKQKKQ